MRALLDMDTIQIEVTNACMNSCSNCTRFCGHHEKPYFMSLDEFRRALDTMVEYPKMTGIMGGEPLLHPQFEEICKYASSKIEPGRLGLWTSLPKGYEHYARLICDTFGHIFINDHTRDDVYHCPVLVAAEEVVPDRRKMFYLIDHCWLQNNWSASINPKGAFFCEVAAALDLLFGGPGGWPVEPYWWARTPKDFTEQVERWCPKCGCALPLPRRRSTDGRDDISPGMFDALHWRSKKLKRGKFVISDLKMVERPQEMAAYKDMGYRQRVAARYGIYLVLNEQKFCTPVYVGRRIEPGQIFEGLKERYGCL